MISRMRHRNFSNRVCLGLLALVGIFVTGCQNGNTVTTDEEKKFKNPPKEMPKEAVDFMKAHSAPPPGAQAPPGNSK